MRNLRAFIALDDPVDARLLDGYDGEFNCAPAESDATPAAGDRVPVGLLAPLDPSAYASLRS